MEKSVKEVKLCLLGDSGVGKSSIVHRFVFNTFNPVTEATIGAAFFTKCITKENIIYKFQIWDTAGQEKYRSLTPMYYRGAVAAIVVYDITKDQSFESVKMWIDELMKHADPKIIIAVAGNKSDLDDQREVLQSDAIEYTASQNVLFTETSAKSSNNILNIFSDICDKLTECHFPTTPLRKSFSTRSLTKNVDTTEKKSNSCCTK